MNVEYDRFMKAYNKLKRLEFSNDPKKFLHQNKTEDHLTLGGCYEKWHKDKIDWHFVHNVVQVCNHDLERASEMLFADREIKTSVALFFKKEFWDKLRLDEVQSQKICNEIFLSACHIGSRNAIKLAQKQVMVLQDGLIGKYTLKALNAYNEKIFDTEFDKLEIENYSKMAVFETYKNGFVKRAKAV